MKILFITLSNIGDVILSLPALDMLRGIFPGAETTVMCGERPSEIFKDSPAVKRCIVYNKQGSLLDRIKLVLELNRENFDVAVDLKNSVLPLFLKAKYKTYPWENAPHSVRHRHHRHLYKVKKFIRKEVKPESFPGPNALYLSEDRIKEASILLEWAGVGISDRLVVVSPGARSHIKRWPAERFAGLADKLIEDFKVKIIVVGDTLDSQNCRAMIEKMSGPAINFCGKTTLKTLAAVLKKASLVISNDSAVMHLSSYLNRPTLAIFGPTDDKKYGPWSLRSEFIRSRISCAPCEAAQCRRTGLACMDDIKMEEVYAAAKRLL